jgi:formamidopyrimidine-DNA glycosylase
MPELPEVQTVVNTLRPRLLGRRIDCIVHLRPDIVTPPNTDMSAHLAGRTITNITRRAKRIIFTLDDANRFYIHLGMSGRLTVEFESAPIQPHTHLILAICNAPVTRASCPCPQLQLRFKDPRRFGGIWWLGQNTDEPDLGPEPLTLRPKALHERLCKTKRPIKSALLDQRLIAGLGNIYVDESLFAAQIHPLKRAHKLTLNQTTRLTKAIKQTLRRALRHRGSTLRDYVDAEGGRGAFQNLHNVYDRASEPCPACQTPIKRIVLTGRSTCFCPKCQRRS